MDTLKSIAQGMEHAGCGLPTGTGFRVLLPVKTASSVCLKCRLLALQSEYEKVDLSQKWLERLRATNSPAVGVEVCRDELITWLAVNVERIKKEARLEEARLWEKFRVEDEIDGDIYWNQHRIAQLEAQAREGK